MAHIEFQYGEETVTLDVEPDGDGWRVHLPDGSEHRFTASRLPNDVLQVRICDEQDTRPLLRVPFARTERGVEFSYRGDSYRFLTPTSSRRAQGKSAGSGELVTPMVGVVAEVLVREGDRVEAYQPLLIVEAMKVMATVEAPFAGTVERLHVTKGQRVEHGATVVVVTPLLPELGEGAHQ